MFKLGLLKRIARKVRAILYSFIPPEKPTPSFFHITHWKAGSQWLYKILHHCASEKIINTEWNDTELVTTTILPNKIYPALYLTHEAFNRLAKPAQWNKIVIIRDLRDALISAYFSIKVSHTVEGNQMGAMFREKVNQLSLEEGMLLVMNERLTPFASIQASWVASGEPLLRYEDLINNDVALLTPIISKALLLKKKKVRAAIIANRFDALTKGRQRGQEDIASHERKGMPGDWKNYFTPHIKQAFKDKFGDLLIQSGYEKDASW